MATPKQSQTFDSVPEKFVGRGSCGNVWLELCVKGKREVEFRAVKEVGYTRNRQGLYA